MKQFFFIFCISTLLLTTTEPADATTFEATNHVAKEAHQPTTLVLLRHLHKTDGEDPGLSECGQAQAVLLRARFHTSQFDEVWHSNVRRTRQTAQALPSRALQAYDPREAVQTTLNRFTGDTVALVGHSNTIPAFIQALIPSQHMSLAEQDYGDLFILTKHEEHWSLKHEQLALPDACKNLFAHQQ